MKYTRNCKVLRSRYRSKWDISQIIAYRNLVIVQRGQSPSDEQLINEQRAAAAVQLARDELLAALSGR